MAAEQTLQALSIGALPQEVVDCPALGGAVLVRGMRLSQRLELRQALAAEAGRHRFAAMVLSACCVDSNGKPLASADDWDAFAAQNEDAATSLFVVANRLCGFDHEDARKN